MKQGSSKIHQETTSIIYFLIAQTALILPHSNADNETVFSLMNYTKSKLRNKMKLLVMNTILARIFGLIRVGKCSSTYALSNTMSKESDDSNKYCNTSSTAQSTSAATASYLLHCNQLHRQRR